MSYLRVPVVAATIALALGASLSTPKAGKDKAYGEPLTGSDTTAITELLARPDRYVDHTVRVEGRVTDVCQKRGCWISLVPEGGSEELRIKVDDGVIVFPVQARGKHAIAEGVFTRITLNMEQTLRYREHQAEEQGEVFDPKTVTEPPTYYQVRAVGAVIQDLGRPEASGE